MAVAVLGLVPILIAGEGRDASAQSVPTARIALAQAQPSSDEGAAKSVRQRTIALYRSEAEEYTIYRDATRKEKLTLEPEPVFLWTNPRANGGQDGAVFVWTSRGRPEVIGTIFVQPPTGRREIIHELHSLSLSVLDVNRSGTHANTWTPEGPGIVLKPIPGAPAPAREASARMVQMRALLRDFTGHTIDRNDREWKLRALPKPLFRYQSTDPDVIDGALFGLVSSAGTDPEALVIIETRRPAPGAAPVWQAGYARFTDHRLSLFHKGAEVFTAPLIQFNTGREDVQHRYRLFSDRFIDADPAGDGSGKASDSSQPKAGR
jgi:hypothetical protein